MRKSRESQFETFKCPQCGLSLQAARGKDGLRLKYDTERWQRHCVAAKLGTPCVCPEFRPSLWPMLLQANQPRKFG
jgi:hypothetical protein